jgi:RNA-binding protein 5/10
LLTFLFTSTIQIAKNISKWNTKKTELKTSLPDLSNPSKQPNAPPAGLSDANAAIGVRQPVITFLIKATMLTAQKPPSTSRPTSADDFDFTETSTMAATGKVACLLCQRQFKSLDLLKKHTEKSDLHKARSFFLN